ncbi:MAG: TRAP transporter small permease [Deltaproteobacteria bacterium]|nr:TRAP transporter small permease [Deltaproteobacteria bacterium]
MKGDFFQKMDGALGVAMRWIGIFCMMALWGIITVTVLSRVVPIVSMGWSDEIVELLFAWMVFLGAAELCRQRKHFTVDLIPNILAGTKKGYALGIVIQLLALVFLLVFTYQGGKVTTLATDRSPYFELSRVFWYACMPLTGLIMTGFTIRNTWRLIRGKPLQHE